MHGDDSKNRVTGKLPDGLRDIGWPHELQWLASFLACLKPRAAIVVGSGCGHVTRTSLSDIDVVFIWPDDQLCDIRNHMLGFEQVPSGFTLDYLGPHVQFGYLFIIRSVGKLSSLDFGIASEHFFYNFMPGPYHPVWGIVNAEPLCPPVERRAVLTQTIWQCLKACASGKKIYAIDYLCRARSIALLILSNPEDFGGMSRQHLSTTAEDQLLQDAEIPHLSQEMIVDNILKLSASLHHMMPHIDGITLEWAQMLGLAPSNTHWKEK